MCSDALKCILQGNYLYMLCLLFFFFLGKKHSCCEATKIQKNICCTWEKDLQNIPMNVLESLMDVNNPHADVGTL